MKWGADGGDDPTVCRSVMGCRELYAHRDARRHAVYGGRGGSKRFGQRSRCPAMQQTQRLQVALDRHGRNHPAGVPVSDRDAELVGELTGREGETFEHLRRRRSRRVGRDGRVR